MPGGSTSEAQKRAGSRDAKGRDDGDSGDLKTARPDGSQAAKARSGRASPGLKALAAAQTPRHAPSPSPPPAARGGRCRLGPEPLAAAARPLATLPPPTRLPPCLLPSSRTGWNFLCLPSPPGRRESECPPVRVRCGAVSSVSAPLARDSPALGTFPAEGGVAAGPGALRPTAARGSSGTFLLGVGGGVTLAPPITTLRSGAADQAPYPARGAPAQAWAAAPGLGSDSVPWRCVTLGRLPVLKVRTRCFEHALRAMMPVLLLLMD
ncbi:actin cytoskeleton-regulatory complex protein PAN1-like [Trachypithecus francoisi]|uniref:actin cytoskeleton-regulatory complex protein PAN1-like n=1 Tax=Trachypithecus francoisi TaxID=54180 RepID=UPI00141B1149|nr:actin cytoskeleton-regulatory complex protein PAN1-like [Trachypithecus francoisi]